MLGDAFFVSETLHERSITLADGSKHKLHFKELLSTAFTSYHTDINSDDEDVRNSAAPKIIAAGLVDADGKPAVSAEKAAQLKPLVQGQMVRAILEVNGFGKKSGND